MLHSNFFRLILILCCFLIISSCKEEEVNYNIPKPRWFKVPGLTGLRHYEVLDMTVDASNNLWVGFGQGVGKYDGQTWTIYRPFAYDLEDPRTNNYAHDIGVDKNGHVWASISNDFKTSACKFDGTTWTTFPLSGSGFYTITPLTNGELWFGSGQFVYNNGTWSSKDCNSYCSPAFASFQDKEGVLWFAGYSGIITKYDGSSFTHTTIPFTPSNDVTDMMQTKSGEIYVAMSNAGAMKFNGTTWEKIFTPKEGGSMSVTAILHDSKGRTWIGTAYNGIFEINEGKISRHIVGDGQDYLITKIIEDKKGDLWFGSIAGVFKLEIR